LSTFLVIIIRIFQLNILLSYIRCTLFIQIVNWTNSVFDNFTIWNYLWFEIIWTLDVIGLSFVHLFYWRWTWLWGIWSRMFQSLNCIDWIMKIRNLTIYNILILNPWSSKLSLRLTAEIKWIITILMFLIIQFFSSIISRGILKQFRHHRFVTFRLDHFTFIIAVIVYAIILKSLFDHLVLRRFWSIFLKVIFSSLSINRHWVLNLSFFTCYYIFVFFTIDSKILWRLFLKKACHSSGFVFDDKVVLFLMAFVKTSGCFYSVHVKICR